MLRDGQKRGVLDIDRTELENCWRRLASEPDCAEGMTNFIRNCKSALGANQALGEPCGSHAECAGRAYCAGSDFPPPSRMPGMPPRTTCPWTCQALARESEPCELNSGCADDLVCRGDPGRCGPQAGLGDPCDPSQLECMHPLYCLPDEAGEQRCASDVLRLPSGAACSNDDAVWFLLCPESEACVPDESDAAEPAQGVCAEPSKQGQSCFPRRLLRTDSCETGLFCLVSDGVRGTCQPLRSKGQPCKEISLLLGDQAGEYCAPPLLCVAVQGNEASCQAPVGVGQLCDEEHVVCAAGKCESGRCQFDSPCDSEL